MGNAPTETDQPAGETNALSSTQADTTIYDHGNADSLASAILEAVSEATGVPSGEIERPLYDVVDLDALGRLFYPRLDGTPRAGGTVSFSYYGCTVTLENAPDSITVSARPE